MWARYPHTDTASASCLFTGLLEERGGTYQTVSIGNLVELFMSGLMPYHYAPTQTLPAGNLRIPCLHYVRLQMDGRDRDRQR